MNTKIFILFIVFSTIISCNNDDDSNNNDDNNCLELNIDIDITSLENEYGCVDTKYQMEINLSEDYTIIRNQSDFDNLVTGSCQPTINFSNYDLIIGKKGLTNGNSTIDYVLTQHCETGNQTLKVTFNQNDTTVAPNLTYHALIPKLGEEQELNVEIIVN